MANDLPSSRSDWASLDWKEAQHHVAKLMNRYGYMIFEEMSFENHKRSDVVVIRQLPDQIVFGIIEVKCYIKITPAMEKKSVTQALKYLRSLYELVENNSRWGIRPKSYFCAIVFTNDYPAIDTHKIATYQHMIPTELLERNMPYLIATTPNSLISRLDQYYPSFHRQSTLDEYW